MVGVGLGPCGGSVGTLYSGCFGFYRTFFGLS